MSTFYVTGNLNHDGKEYKRGDAIELVDIAAPALIEMGIVQEAPVAAPEKPAEENVSEASKDEVTVGGSETKTGEPSLDAGLEESNDADAREVGPRAPVAVQEAPVAAPEKPARRLFRKAAAPRIEDKTPENDPSANL